MATKRQRIAKYRAKRIASALEALATLDTRTTAEIPDYDRAEFGSGWKDTDSDGQDERAEVLIEFHRPGRKRVPLVYADQRNNRVVSGRWRCRFSGKWYSKASDLDIDHMIPLAEVWASGGHAWTKAKREQYANGVGFMGTRKVWLLPVDDALNQSKGSKTPDQWLPPNANHVPMYCANWVWAKHFWGLDVTAAERAKLLEVLTAAQTQYPAPEPEVDPEDT